MALLPPADIQEYANQIKQHFAAHYDSRAALKSPPHITLQPPFKWANEAVLSLKQSLTQFTNHHQPVPIKLQGFAAFPPRVIYINVLKTQELLTLQADLMAYLATHLEIIDLVAQKRSFAPHMTVAFRDLTRQNFRAAWAEFQHRSFEFEFTATSLTLLIHDGKRWNVEADFPLTRHQSEGE